jgi:hypothetical protein
MQINLSDTNTPVPYFLIRIIGPLAWNFLVQRRLSCNSDGCFVIAEWFQSR